MRPAGIGRNVSADGRRFLRRRIGSVKESVVSNRARKIEVDQTRRHAHAPVSHVEFENAVHARRPDDHTAGNRHRTAAQPGSGPACDDRLAAVVGDFNDGRYIARRSRQRDGCRRSTFRVRVEGICGKIFGRRGRTCVSPSASTSRSRSINRASPIESTALVSARYRAKLLGGLHFWLRNQLL